MLNTAKLWDGLHNKKFWGNSFDEKLENLGRKYYRWVINWLLQGTDLRNKTVLEFGCGSGKNSINLACDFGAAEITLLDFSPVAIQRIEERLQLANYNFETKLVLGDLLSPPIKGEYDLVHSMGVIEHFEGEERKQAVGQHVKFCKKGGLIMIFCPTDSTLGNLLSFYNRSKGFYEQPVVKKELVFLLHLQGAKVIKTTTMVAGTAIGVLARRG